MALVWRCDRCKRISDMGDVDDPPEDWPRMDMPCRGSKGAKSRQTLVLCDECDDDLYRWLRRPFAASKSVHSGGNDALNIGDAGAHDVRREQVGP